MDTNTKRGIEELTKNNERDRETVYVMLEERGASQGAVDTVKAMVMIVEIFNKSRIIKELGIDEYCRREFNKA